MVEIVFPLSDAVAKLIEPVSRTAEGLQIGLSQRLFEVLPSLDRKECSNAPQKSLSKQFATWSTILNTPPYNILIVISRIFQHRSLLGSAYEWGFFDIHEPHGIYAAWGSLAHTRLLSKDLL
ncbi:hypothetical protein N7468_001053 [Penicillium chermesinum]|uniref:Uncharacterized protein n=1 Tax=Penicillium chermesinum TaxID=63820 RepID=A0A9W9TWF2_9EURO|nr:uncharacterized protein N7468_001053 [Penicillium chermesinum]KAJ5246070.1 hypothetical protein N7468_001053 [Penicillium chermesinum]